MEEEFGAVHFPSFSVHGLVDKVHKILNLHIVAEVIYLTGNILDQHPLEKAACGLLLYFTVKAALGAGAVAAEV